MTQVSRQGIHRVDQNMLVHILEYADTTNAAKVSRLFYRAMKLAQDRLVSTLSLTRNTLKANLDDDEGLEDRVDLACQKFTEKLESLVPREHEYVRIVWQQILDLRENELREKVPEIRIFLSMKLLHVVEEVTRSLPQFKDQEVRKSIEQRLIDWVACGTVLRFFRDKKCNPNMRSGALLAALEDSRKEALLPHRESYQAYKQYRRAYSHSFCYGAHLNPAVCLAWANAQKDLDMFSLWDGVSAELIRKGVGLSTHFRAAAQIRAWLNEQENGERVQAVTHLVTIGLGHIPHEIGLFDNLEALRAYGSLAREDLQLSMLPQELGALSSLITLDLAINSFEIFPMPVCELRNLRELAMGKNRLDSLPDEIVRLQNLRVLGLWNNRFQTLPEVLFSLPHLADIDFYNLPDLSPNNEIRELPAFLAHGKRDNYLRLSNNPIAVLPDAVFRYRETRWSFLRLNLHGIINLELTRENLKEIPFRLWFKEKIRIPSPPFISTPQNRGRCQALFLRSLSFLGNVPIALFKAAALPINALLYHVGEPVVTTIRDKLGYKRMVELRVST